MPFDPLEIRVSLQKLLIGLILVIVPLSFVGLYLTSESDTALKQTLGIHFRTIAQTEATAIAQFINDRTLDVATLAVNPAVRNAIAETKRSRKALDNATTAARVRKIESAWDTPEVNSLVDALLSSPASQVLRQYREVDPRILKIIVADETGTTAAATDKPLHYIQPDQAYWQAVYGKGGGGIYVSELRYDDQSSFRYLEIGVPVLEEGTGRFVGAVNALVDVSSLLRRFQREDMGRTARSMLVKDDGTVISAPNVDASRKLKLDEYSAVSDALGTLQGRQRGYVVASRKGEDRIVGFADVGLKPKYSNLGWLVLVSQDEEEALAPFRSVAHFALSMVVLALLMLTLLTVYFFLHRKQRLESIEMANREEAQRRTAASA